MKKWLLSVGALLAVLMVALHAQDIVGTWQGTLQIQGRDMRLVFPVDVMDIDRIEKPTENRLLSCADSPRRGAIEARAVA